MKREITINKMYVGSFLEEGENIEIFKFMKKYYFKSM